MTRASDPDELSGPRKWTSLVRYAAPCLAGFALVLVIAGEQIGLDEDLQIVVPKQTQPGARLPMRARLYAQLRAPEGPTLRPAQIDVELVTMSGQRLGHAQLSPARAGTPDSEGELSIPDVQQRLQVRAQTEVDDHFVRTHAWLTVEASRARASALPEGRSLRVLQQFSEGALLAEPGAIAPSPLRVRVAGGACVPESPCRAFVHVGTPAAAVRIEANSTLTPSVTVDKALAAVSGVVELSFVTHGPEAELWLIAEREGRRVAHRAVRLPVAMAAVSVRASELVIAADEQPRVLTPGAADGCIVDAFAGSSWERTGSLAHCDRPSALPFPALPPGIHRLQVRRDVFSAQTAGVAVVAIRTPGDTLEQLVTALAREAQHFDAEDALVQTCVSDPAQCVDRATLGYLAAILEVGIIEPPRAVSGYDDRLALLSDRQARLRNLSLLALALGGLALALTVGRRGLLAGAQARELLARESLDPQFVGRSRVRSLILVVASVTSLVLVFVVIGLYVLARGGY